MTQKHFKPLLVLCCMIFSTIVKAQENIVLHYDFSRSTSTTVEDISGSSQQASLKNSATVIKMGTYNVLSLGTENGYLDLGKKAGELFRTLDQFTISVYYRVDEKQDISMAGNYLWSFSTTVSCGNTSGRYSAYRINAQRAATASLGSNTEKAVQKGCASSRGRWVHVAYSQNEKVGSLYIDGQLVGSSQDMYVNSENFKLFNINYAFIGRSPFAADSYLKNTLIYDFRLYNSAINADEISILSKETEKLDFQYRYGSVADFSELIEENRKACELAASIEPDEYPDNAIAEYMDAIHVSQTLIDEAKVSQSVVNMHIQLLKDAYSKLQGTKGYVFDTNGIKNGYDTERGFRHPGGLHTQADFDRVKAQLASGNPTVVKAYEVLKSSPFSNANVKSNPLKTIIRGGAGENYITAAQGASMAYQNALRWKIEGTEANAKTAVRILNEWANTTESIGGDPNYALNGLYGNQFAQAAELMRDYEGWEKDDFEHFRSWMRNLWYPMSIGFLRWRNGCWVNEGRDGHRASAYWSNWGLCNAFTVMSIGILLDDVFIYNQGLSYIKDDIEGEFDESRSVPITVQGPTEFIGNLIPAVFEDERGPYGKLGQMQESGRDQGHCTLSVGLITDICLLAWNQGDDLFSYMDNRIAAGIEYVAAYNFSNVDDLPWSYYRYCDAYTPLWEGWIMTEPSESARGNMRNYWGKIIGHYEGVKGVRMKYSEVALEKMGIDGGPSGGNGGAYDHLGFSVLMNTRDFATEKEVPTLLTPLVEYAGKILNTNSIGGKGSNWLVAPTTAAPTGGTAKLMPQLPEGVADTGKWKWNTGEETKDITINMDKSFVYRVTYTNENGIESEQDFTVAIAGDCEEDELVCSITDADGNVLGTTSATVFYGSEIKLNVKCQDGYGYHYWDNGQYGEKASSITFPSVTTDRTVEYYYLNQGGRKCKKTFNVKVASIRPTITVENKILEDSLSVIVRKGVDVTLSATASLYMDNGTYLWDENVSGNTLTIEDIDSSEMHRMVYTRTDGATSELTYMIYVYANNDEPVDIGDYLIHHLAYDTYLTNTGDLCPVFLPLSTSVDSPEANQVWNISRAVSARYDIISLLDNRMINAPGELVAKTYKPQRIKPAIGTNCVALYTSYGNYWNVSKDGEVGFDTELNSFPFELIKINGEPDGIESMKESDTELSGDNIVYDIAGRRITTLQSSLRELNLSKGIYILNGKKIFIK